MSHKQDSSTQEHFNKLKQFRQAAYGSLGNGKDALFELSDAVIQLRTIQSFAELSCAPSFRRKWSSAYEALQDGRPDRVRLAQLYLEQVGETEPLLLAGDHTAWEHLWTPTLAERSYQHQPSPIPGRRPITIGHGYSTLAIVPEKEGSWALPLVHERLLQQKPVESAAQQLERVCPLLPKGSRPLSLWDSEYGCAAFVRATQAIPADKLIRLRTNLGLEGPTKPYRGRGQRPKHGIPFQFRDPNTWWAPDQVLEYEDPDFGPLRVQIWRGLRFRQALDCLMIVARVERLQQPGTRRKPRILWFAWLGQEPPLRWWSIYNRRYPIDHWYRFAKGRLHWTAPKVATPDQADCWSDLMPLITWELWLARTVVQDQPLPWQKPQTHLAPGRVCQGMANILVAIGTPTRACKTRGIAPGWPKGKPRAKRARYDLIRSKQWAAIRERKKTKTAGEAPKRGHPKKENAPPTA
jgi:hypothetical protein